MPVIYAIILAAGYSRRMGSDKLSMDLCGKKVLQHAIDQVFDSGADSVYVVIREPEQADAFHRTKNTSFVVNSEAIVGISSSIRTAINQMDGREDAVLIVNGDMPFFGSSNYRALIDLWNQTDQGIAASYYMGDVRNPVIFARRFLSELLEINGDRGAKSIVQKNLSDVKFLEILDPDYLMDIDTPEELEYARSMCNRLISR